MPTRLSTRSVDGGDNYSHEDIGPNFESYQDFEQINFLKIKCERVDDHVGKSNVPLKRKIN